jgi:hypothetical protein
MKHDQSAASNVRRIHLIVPSHAFIAVVPVNEEKINFPVAQSSGQPPAGLLGMGVRSQEDDFLLVPTKLSKLELSSFIVSASERAAGQINARNNGIVGSQSAQCPERAPFECAYLKDRLQIELSKKANESGKFRDLLRGPVLLRPNG